MCQGVMKGRTHVVQRVLFVRVAPALGLNYFSVDFSVGYGIELRPKQNELKLFIYAFRF